MWPPESSTLMLLQLACTCLPVLLVAYWVLAAGSVFVTLLPVPVPQAFKDAVVLSACRGKLWQDKPAALGRWRDWSVPQRWFLHFYQWGSVVNLVALIALSANVGTSSSSSSSSMSPDTVRALLLLALFQLHLLRRCAETGLLLHYPEDAQMHGIAYVFGLSYYTVVSLSLLPQSWACQLERQAQQQQQAQHQAQLAWRQAPAMAQAAAAQLWEQLSALPGQLGRVQLLGVAVFLAGNVLQFAAHHGLAAMAKQPAFLQGGSRHGYVIPSGGLFELVSCPHYLAEILIYAGLLAASGGQLLPALMLVWVTVNLALAADATHKWYRRRFKAYPPQRRALIPFVY